MLICAHFRIEKRKFRKLHVTILKSELRWQIVTIDNQFSPGKAAAKGQNKIIKEVSKASGSLIKNHILLKVQKPWRVK